MSSNIKAISFWVVPIGLAIVLFAFFRPGQGTKELRIPVSEFVNRVEAGQVKEVTIAGNDAKGTLENGSIFRTQIPTNFPDLYKRARDPGWQRGNADRLGPGTAAGAALRFEGRRRPRPACFPARKRAARAEALGRRTSTNGVGR
jgi:hypothetical protein